MVNVLDRVVDERNLKAPCTRADKNFGVPVEATLSGLVAFLEGGRQDACVPRIVTPKEWVAEGVVGTLVGVDFETYYSGDYSVASMGTWAYCQDARFDAYLVAVADFNKVCVCRPEEFPWGSIEGLKWVSHNREFDKMVYERLFAAEDGGFPGQDDPPPWRTWNCTAAVCAYLQLSRDLAGAVEALFGVKLDKSVRKAASGKLFMGHVGSEDLFGNKLHGEIFDYAARDAVACLALWLRLEGKWPDRERRLFEMTCEMGRQGLAMDWEYVGESRRDLVRKVAEMKESLPWSPALSIPKFKTACEAVGVPAPSSTKVDDPGFLVWAKKYHDTKAGEWVRTVQAVRSANRTEKVLGAMEARKMSESARGQRSGVEERPPVPGEERNSNPSTTLRTGVEHRTSNFERRNERPLVPGEFGGCRQDACGPGGRMVYELKYCGANTARWSGEGGLNMQNLNRSEAEGVDLRKAITAAPGHVLGVVDYAQIESRVLLYLAGDQETLTLLREHPEMDVYEVHARATMGYGAERREEVRGQKSEASASVEGPGQDGPRPVVATQGTARPTEEESLKDFCARTGSTLRQLAKARVLGLGFGCGKDKFISVAKSMAGLDISLAESERIVREYRESNPKVVGLWRRLEDACRAKVGGDYVLPLPCTQWDREYGRYLIYRDVRLLRRELRCRVGGQDTGVYGGLLAENFTQATARDVLAEAWLCCADAGYFPVLSVHDELVFELPEATAEADLSAIVSLMEDSMPWAPGLPLKAEGSLMKFYQK